uniref:Thioesterase superfamily protein n=1 Tax=Tanacetum cinerariifolium TaxID=118510 RepID=A0A6L2KRI4_TANCI|nr:thioesterase superfamily protein [Tanacetum cinerariifolium]
MDNRRTPAPSNSQTRQNRVALFPNRRDTQIVEDHEPSSRRINTEAEILADENNQAIPIVISSGSEDDSDDDAAYEEAERQRKGKMVVSASKAEPKRKGRVAAPEIPGIVIREQENGKFVNPESESESDSEEDAVYQRQLNVAKLESLNTQNMEAPEPSEAEQRSKGKAAEHDIPLGAEYKRQLEFAIQESLKSYYNNSAGRSLDVHALRTETGLARGNIGNEDSVDEGAQTEALDAVRGNESPKGKRKIKAKKQKIAEPDVARGKFINSASDTEPTGSMPYQRVSSRGRVLKPTYKLLQLANVTDARAREGTSGSERKQTKKHLLNNVTAQARSMPRIPVGVVDGSEDAPLPLNRGPRRSFRRYGSQHNRLQSSVADASELTGSVSVVSQAGQANGVAQADVVNPHGSGAGSEVGGSEPDADYWIPDLIVVPFLDPTSVAGQASEGNAVGRQTDMVVPLLEPMYENGNWNAGAMSVLIDDMAAGAAFSITGGNLATVDFTMSFYSTVKVNEEIEIEASVVGEKASLLSVIIRYKKERFRREGCCRETMDARYSY